MHAKGIASRLLDPQPAMVEGFFFSGFFSQINYAAIL